MKYMFMCIHIYTIRARQEERERERERQIWRQRERLIEDSSLCTAALNYVTFSRAEHSIEEVRELTVLLTF